MFINCFFLLYIFHRHKNKARVDEINLLLQGLPIPNPSLAADEPLLQPLELEKIPIPAQTSLAPNPWAPSTSSSCAMADDPEVVILEKVENIPSNGKYVVHS